jgi:putative nucleic acid modification protein with dual OB domain
MPEVKHILILANSARAGKHCVAGKVVSPLDNGEFRPQNQWIRLNCSTDDDGAVPYATTICRNHGLVKPLDIIKVTLEAPCNNPDHPEDWHYDHTQPWQFVSRTDPSWLPKLADSPATIWNAGGDEKSVPAGHVRKMGARAATLYLIKSPPVWTFTFWKEPNPFEPNHKTFRRLGFTYAGIRQDFSVTDTDFTDRHHVFDKMQLNHPQTLALPNPEKAFFCLSLTKLTPTFNRAHYKICATIFEP